MTAAPPSRPVAVGRNYLRLTPGRPAGPQLVCFPWAGVGSQPFRTWIRWTPEEVGLVAVRTGGREDRLREPAPTDLTALVAELTDELPDAGPVVFLGHCLGALLAFEVTRELRRRRRLLPHRLLVVGDAPGRLRPEPVTDVRAELRASGAVSAAVLDNPDVFAMFEPAVTADFALAAGYRYAPESRLPVPVDVLAATGTGPPDVTGWAAETTGPVSGVTLDGPHLFPAGAWRPLADAAFAAVRQADGAR